MRSLERVFDDAYDTFNGVKICGAQRTAGLSQIAGQPRRGRDAYPWQLIARQIYARVPGT